MDKELRQRLYWLQEELTEEDRDVLFEEEEEEIILPPRRRRSYAEKQEMRTLEELDPLEKRSTPVVKKKGIKGYVILAILEILGILLVMGWWLQWLI